MITRSARSRLAKLLALLLAFSLFAAACGDDDDSTSSDDDQTTDTTPDDDGDAPATSAPEVGENEDEATEDEDAEGVRGGTLTIAVEAPSDGLDPTANNFAQSAYMMGYAIYDPLFYIDTEGNWFPFLAESAEMARRSIRDALARARS